VFSTVSLGNIEHDIDPEDATPAAEASCAKQLTTTQLWTRRGFITVGAGAVGVGGYLGFEYANTDPNFEQASDFDPSAVGKGALNVAVYGDSLVRGEGYNSLQNQFWAIRTRRRGWPMDLDRADSSAVTLFERLRELSPDHPLRVANHAWPGAYVDPAVNQSGSFKKYGFGVRDFTTQINEVASSSDAFPNLHLLLAGHNNTDWFYDIDKYGLEGEKYKLELPKLTVDAYEQAMQPLIERAEKTKYPVTIVVYGLINLKSVFIAREAALKYKEGHPDAYMYSDISGSFPSLLKDHQPTTIRIAGQINARLKSLVDNSTDNQKMD